MSRGAACGPPFGMGWDVESSCGPGMWFPLCFGSSLGLGCVTGQSRVNIVHMYEYCQGVRVTPYGRAVRESPYGGPARRRVRLQEGWFPASAGMTDKGAGMGGGDALPWLPLGMDSGSRRPE